MATKKRKGPIRVGPRHIEAGTQYTGYGGVMRRQGSIYGYGRDPEGGYRSQRQLNLPPGYTVDSDGVVRLISDVSPSGRYTHTRDWFKDIKILVVLGTTVAAFLISFLVLDVFYEKMIQLAATLNVSTDTMLALKPTFQIALGVVTSLILIGGMIILFFNDRDVNADDYLEGFEE